MTRPRLALPRRAAALGLLAGLAACVNRESAQLAPGANLAGLRRFYVVRFEPDTRGINTIVVDELRRLGFTATTGEAANRPPDVDAVVTYGDRWMWDITMYMLSLDIVLRDPRTDFPIASGNSYHTSLTRKSPEEMVREVLGNIFRQGAR
jgi:hypothetical protein